MSYIKNILNNNGSITVPAALILCSIIIFNITLYDYTSLKLFESRNKAHLKLACNSVLSCYDALLADEFGLYGYNIAGVSSPEDLFIRYYDASDFNVTLSENFTEPEVLKQQILKLMKLKIPVGITEMILESLDVIEKAEYKADGFEKCGNAAELLKELQNLQNQLKLKVEGLYPGDRICVNGYSEYALIKSLELTGMEKNQITDEEIFKFADNAAAINEQYIKLNNEAALICKKLNAGAELIEQMLSDSSKYSDVEKYAKEIKKQTNNVSSTQAAEKINDNILILNRQLDFFRKLRKKEVPFLLSNIVEFLSKEKVNTDIKINILYSENSDGMHEDVRGVLKTKIKDNMSAVILSKDTYEINSMEYASLPSNRVSFSGNAPFDFFSFNSKYSLESFDEFKGLFSCFKGISFKEMVKDAADNVAVNSYITEYMTNRLDAPSKIALNNKAEYIIGGDSSCNANNKSVEEKIVALRFIINFIEIINDTEKNAIAEGIADVIASLVSYGCGRSLYKLIIISAWALIDSYSDLGKLLLGESVPIIKTNYEAADKKQNYLFYLQILLFMMPQETKLMRICDIIEIDMSALTGMKYRLNGVYNVMSVKTKKKINFIFPILTESKEEYYFEDFCTVCY